MSTTTATSESAAVVTVVVDRPSHRPTTALRLERLGIFAAGSAALIGAAVLVGYATRNASVVKLAPQLPPMYPNAAIGLLSGGVAVIASRRSGAWRWVAAAGTAVVGAIGVVGLWLNISDHPATRFDLFPDDFIDATTPVGGRPVAETCVAFILLAAALTSLTTRRRPLMGQVLGMAGLSVGLSAVVGYVLGVDRTSLGSNLAYVGMALHTGLGIALVGASVILVRPGVGFVAQLLDAGISGTMARRATLTIVAAPLGLIAVNALLSAALPTTELSQSVFSVIQVSVLGAAVLVPAALLASTESQLRQQLDEVRRGAEHDDDVVQVLEAITGEMTVVVPDVPGWDIAMRYQPATGHLAGDSVQVHHRVGRDAATLVAIIDIAGHDAYSAVVAYGLRAHIGALWESGATLHDLVQSVNNKIVRRKTIATGVLFAVADGSRTVQFANCGHPPPLHVHGDHSSTWARTSPLLGIAGSRLAVNTYEVAPGDLIVAYTDGLVDTRNANKEELGDATIHRVVQMYRDQPTDTIAAACMDAALQHASQRLKDDALVVVART
jgi:serine phosphatase RsbU (regulator of sigma subunit)